MSLLRYFKLQTGSKGVTQEGDVTSTDISADTQALDVAVKSTTGLTNAQLRAVPVPVSGTVNVVGELNTSGQFGIDAGGRTRISQVTTLLDGKILGEDDPLLFENVGSGTPLYGNNKVNLSVASGQYLVRQTKRFYPYFSGKDQLIEATFDNFQAEANVTKRVGYFSSSTVAPYTASFDGFFIEVDDAGVRTLKAFRSGTQTVDVAFTAMDNYDAISAYNWSNFTVVAFDFLWLGGAVLRFWVKTDSGFVLVHTVNYSGTATDTFTLTPNLPLRYEIRSSTGTGSFRYICSQVATEGSINESGKSKVIFNATAITTNVVGTIYALKGIKKRSGFLDTAIQVIEFGVADTNTSQSDRGIIMLFINPTLSAPITYANNGKIQEGTATTQTITAGTGRLIAAIPAGGASQESLKENFLAFLSQSITGDVDEYVLAYMPTTATQRVHGILTVKEI